MVDVLFLRRFGALCRCRSRSSSQGKPCRQNRSLLCGPVTKANAQITKDGPNNCRQLTTPIATRGPFRHQLQILNIRTSIEFIDSFHCFDDLRSQYLLMHSISLVYVQFQMLQYRKPPCLPTKLYNYIQNTTTPEFIASFPDPSKQL